MPGCLYILTGPSGCGKTTLLNSLCENMLVHELRIAKVPKFSTRKERNEKDDVTQLIDEHGDPHIELGKGPFYDKNGLIVDVGINGIDIAYAINQERYGISTSLIDNLIKKDQNAFIILSDFRIIKRLKKQFHGISRAVYIASAVDPKKLEAEQTRRLGLSKEKTRELSSEIDRLEAASNLGLWDRVAECIGDLNDYWKRFKPGADYTEARVERIRTFHTRYIDHITLFDNVILNYIEGEPEKMIIQMNNIITNSYKTDVFNKKKAFPPIFVVAAASGAGKGTMMQMLGLIGSDIVRFITKLAGRDIKENDKQDGMLAIGKPGKPPKKWPNWPAWWSDAMISKAMKGIFPDEYDLNWDFHKYVDKEKEITIATQYAVSTYEINLNIHSNTPQIFVSNTHQFDRFREKYGNRVVFIYLYRLSSAEDTAEWYKTVNPDPVDATARIDEIRYVHECYIDRIIEFNHVLLNTTRQEDLYDQIFQLIEYYYDNTKE